MLALKQFQSSVMWFGLCLSVPLVASCATASNKQAGHPNPPPAVTASTPMMLPPAAPVVPEPAGNSGSLWRNTSHSLVSDNKARKVGDVITITVSEKAQASKQSTNQTGRTKDFSGDLAFNGFTYAGSNLVDAASTGYSGKFGNNFKGTGTASRTDTMTTYMTATVVDILPNGNLVIRGSRWTKVNEEMQQIILEGMVRPNDINRNNQILSQNIADAKIYFVGKGPITATQKPGWLGQLFDVISPF
jgi:flagellar L-ring protein precursor FlgH